MIQRYPYAAGHALMVVTPKLDIENTLDYYGHGSSSGKFYLIEEKRLPF